MSNVVEMSDFEYPDFLRQSRYPPKRLYGEGDVSLLKHKKLAAVVGTRRMSEYGKKVTERFVRELSQRGFVIVSGLARGVDRVAHETCLACGGKTIAVLAHGLQMTYPPEHQELRKKIVACGGLILSEYPPNVKLTKQQLILRNRIVVGLGSFLLVTESPKSSGTKNAVFWAGEMGKDVFVVPGPIEDPTYEGSVELMREGGVAVASPEDLLAQIVGVVS